MKKLSLGKETLARLALKTGMKAGDDSRYCGNTRNVGPFGCILDPAGGSGPVVSPGPSPVGVPPTLPVCIQN